MSQEISLNSISGKMTVSKVTKVRSEKTVLSENTAHIYKWRGSLYNILGKS